ncbi:MAG: hypothetical protein NT080_00930 [Spirochaetes bacterium]|nr:hypothetical protein [Spirochaetota bacterium]
MAAEKQLIQISIPGGVRKVAAGGEFTVVLKKDRTVWAAGDNMYGQIGDGTTSANRPLLSQLMDGEDPIIAKDIQAGCNNTVLVRDDDSLWACGFNTSGQLGNGTANILSPKLIMQGVLAVSPNNTHTLVLKNDCSLCAMGTNTSGELGDGTATGKSVPTRITQNVKCVAAGRNYSMFVRMDGSIWGMGLNTSAQLGDGTIVNKTAGPVQIGY